MNVAGERSGAAGQETAGEAVPEFYVALEFTDDGRCCRPGLPFAPLTEAVARVTATGSELARIAAPPPYGTFTGVTAAAGNRTFVLTAQKLVTFSATTGTLLREHNHLHVYGGYQHVPWASPSGQLLIVTGTQPGPTIGSFNLGHSAGTLSQGRFTPIPWSTRTFAAAW